MFKVGLVDGKLVAVKLWERIYVSLAKHRYITLGLSSHRSHFHRMRRHESERPQNKDTECMKELLKLLRTDA